MADDDKHLTEQPVSREELFKGRLLHAVRDTVRLPDGTPAQREFILHPGAVMVIPLLADGRIVLERQYRYPVREVLIEFPAGKLDAGEDPLVCGQRELLEETGYTAAEWAYAGKLALAVGYSDEYIHLFFARGLVQGAAQLDHGEFVETITATPDEFLEWCRDGRVKDSKTLVGALWLQNVLSGSWNLDWQSPPSSP
jgi:ADP-ribose pyrophosphatase